MTAWAARVRRWIDTPSLWWDLTTLGSPLRMGSWLLFINGTLAGVLGMAVTMTLLWPDHDLQAIAAEIGLGQYMTVWLFGTLGAIITILVPLRAAGLFEGPRWGRYFDQLVLTGLSPGRYFLGKLASQNVFFAALLLPSLPFATFCFGLGGVTLLYPLECIAVLWIYTNVLTVATMAAATVQHEVFAIGGVILGFGTAYGIGVGPFPVWTGILTPSHAIVAPFWDSIVGQGGFPGLDYHPNRMTATFGGWTFEIGNATVLLVGATAISWCAGGLLLLGPLRFFGRPGATFGECIMEGDSKRSSFFLRRFTLRRSVDVSFFFENRSEWVSRWEALLRPAWLVGTLTLFLSLPFIVLHGVSTNVRIDEVHLSNLVIYGIALLVAAVCLCPTRDTLCIRLRAGTREYPVPALQTFCFLAVASILTAWAVGVPAFRDWLEGSSWTWTWQTRSSPRFHRDAATYQAMGPWFLLFGVQFYAFVRWAGTRLWQTGAVAGLAVPFIAIAWVGPFAIGALGAFLLPDSPVMVWLCTRIADLSPIAWMISWIEHSDGTPFTSMDAEMAALFHGGAGRTTLWVQSAITALLAWGAWRATGRTIVRLGRVYAPGSLREPEKTP